MARELYPYQVEAINQINSELNSYKKNTNVLFQLPTGGGKTVIFSEIAKNYIKEHKKKVLILTHRIELCRQTSSVLDSIDVENKVITADVKYLMDSEDHIMCYTAMVETLHNRLVEDNCFISDVGLVIVDEAHYNSFRKIFKYFADVNILGVTATPLSSNRNLPLKDNYDHLVVGNSISGLIKEGFLSEGTTFTFDVNLKGLKVGIHGDYTVASIEHLYSNTLMQSKLLHAYQEVGNNKKTLIFNAGIVTSRSVEQLFNKAGYKIKHLDSTFSKQERNEILQWFHETPDAILTSVGILTTGFDEPSVENIILNRATRSLTLYHQMIGRGSRIYGDVKKFSIIDLGNNARRLGYWDDSISWHEIFLDPDKYLDKQLQIEKGLEEMEFEYEMPPEIRERFPHLVADKPFLIKNKFKEYQETGQKTKMIIDEAIDHHFELVSKNCSDKYDALELATLLHEEIEHRMKQYSKCVNGTDNYANWLIDEYNRRLNRMIVTQIAAPEEEEEEVEG